MEIKSMNVIGSAGIQGVIGPDIPVAMLAGWAIGCAVGAAVLVGGGRALYLRRPTSSTSWSRSSMRFQSFGEDVAAWAIGGAVAGLVIGLVIGFLRWASHLATELGVGLGAFLLLAALGVFFLVTANARGHQ
jgi:hypothetical protein